jgi:hypothetical protein
MADSAPSKDQLEQLASQIQQDQVKTNPAEKRVKIDMSFKKAVKKITRTPPPQVDGWPTSPLATLPSFFTILVINNPLGPLCKCTVQPSPCFNR